MPTLDAAFDEASGSSSRTPSPVGLEAGAGVAKVSWTPELRDAWTEVWVTVATTMKGDLYGTSSK